MGMNGAEIKSLLAKAKIDAISFAFGRGEGESQDVLILDRRKTPEALFKILRQEEGVKRGLWGHVTLQGATAIFKPEKPLTGAEKEIRELFKREHLTIKVQVEDVA